MNIEADVLVKFAEQQMKAKDFDLTADYLIANGY